MARLKSNHFVERLKWGEDTIAIAVFAVLTFFPALEILTRLIGRPGIPASAILVQHMTLWIGFIGAVLATRQNKLLSLIRKPLFQEDKIFHLGRWIAKNISFIVILFLFWGSLNLVIVEYNYPTYIAPGILRWVGQSIMPLGFLLIAAQIFLKSTKNHLLRATMLMITIFIIIISLTDAFQDNGLFLWCSVGLILFSMIFGTPIFIGLGGLAILFFWSDYTPISAISAETYRIVVSPSLPTIPLFTLAGYILAESRASERMLQLFRTAFGWLPGGTPVVIVLLCGFFTALTGGSGVTILALGGLLFPLLRKEGYSELFSLGLITMAGSLGLLFPPSLPLIIYGVTALVSIKDLFIGALIPGIILSVAVAGYSIFQGYAQHVERQPFNLKQIWAELKNSYWEVIIPLLILYGVFGGYTTLVETSSIAVIYIFIVEVFVYKDLSIRDMPRIIIDCATLIGGVLIILGVAMGLTSYIVDAQIPMLLMEWVKETITSKYVFLLLLNILLLVVGCLMDIFSAIIIVVPLIIPLLGLFPDIHPVHLAVIIIANLELGYLTPPVGMNLFLSAYRFDKDMPVVYKATLPFFLLSLIVVLAITYIPILSLGLLRLFQ
ncbi:MAG: TRAP transporter large permease subunit [Candidatus Neomarinimicrobiota bacterium]|jgi:tripartite ATP-independent transporter DctM subunit|nr:TRAP transporter large permease subunit [Candidatus Neomarinimicrobiota bacterium]